jgi:hypothetical protein
VIIPPLTEAIIARFWQRVDVRGPDECWPWLATRTRKGYGKFYISAKSVRAHRVSLMIAGHDLSALGAFACHHCDNPSCVNPAHLYVGDLSSNYWDMRARGRSWDQKRPEFARQVRSRNGKNSGRGANNARAKLTWEQADEIRRSNLTNVELSKRYGLSQTCVRRVRNGETYKP